MREVWRECTMASGPALVTTIYNRPVWRVQCRRSRAQGTKVLISDTLNMCRLKMAPLHTVHCTVYNVECTVFNEMCKKLSLLAVVSFEHTWLKALVTVAHGNAQKFNHHMAVYRAPWCHVSGVWCRCVRWRGKWCRVHLGAPAGNGEWCHQNF